MSQILNKTAIQADDFWQYAITVYALDPVKDASLWVQDKLAGNVNICLLMMYAKRFSYHLEQSDIRTLQLAIYDSDVNLKAHRVRRKSLKQKATHSNAIHLQAYQAALDTELLMEKAQQQVLISSFNRILDDQDIKVLEQRELGNVDALQLYLNILTEKTSESQLTVGAADIKQTCSVLLENV